MDGGYKFLGTDLTPIGNAAFSKSANNNKWIFKLRFKKWSYLLCYIFSISSKEKIFKKHRALQRSFRSIFILVSNPYKNKTAGLRFLRYYLEGK